MAPVMRLYVADKKEVKGYRYVLLRGCGEKRVKKIEKILSEDFDVYSKETFALASGYRKKRPDAYGLGNMAIEVHEGFHKFLKRRLGGWRMSHQAYLFNENFACAVEDYWTNKCVRSLKNGDGKKFLNYIKRRKRFSVCFRTNKYGNGKKVNNAKKMFDGLYFSLYPEASSVLEMYGVEKSLEIFADTIETACKKGFDSGLKYFLSYLPESNGKSVNVKNVLSNDFRYEHYDCKEYTPDDLAKEIIRGIKRQTK